MQYPGKARVGEPAKYIPFTSLSGLRVAARGDALGHTAPRCGIQEKIRQESPPNPFLLRPTLDPASQRGVTCRSVIPHPDAVSRKSSGRSVRKIHSFYVPLWPRVAARGDALGHTAPRCGIQEKIRQECPPNPFLLRPTLDPASQRGVTRCHTAPRCGIQKMLERESPQDTFPFASLSGPRVAARGDALGHTAPRCSIQEKLG